MNVAVLAHPNEHAIATWREHDRRPAPRVAGTDPWSHEFEISEDAVDDSLDDSFDDGGCAIDEVDSMERDVWSWAKGRAGFEPKSIVTIR